jgi:hypothetical protein
LLYKYFKNFATNQDNDDDKSDICPTKLAICELYTKGYLCNDVATGIFSFI